MSETDKKMKIERYRTFGWVFCGDLSEVAINKNEMKFLCCKIHRIGGWFYKRNGIGIYSEGFAIDLWLDYSGLRQIEDRLEPFSQASWERESAAGKGDRGVARGRLRRQGETEI